MSYAIITLGGKQYRVQEGERLLVDRLKTDEGKVDVKMTLTAPGCPASAYIHQDVKRKLEQLQGVKEAVVNIVWDPPWTPEMMSEAAKKQFGWGI